MTKTELTQLIEEEKTASSNSFTDLGDFHEMSEIENLRIELDDANKRIKYLSMAQHYTSIVGRALTAREIDALLTCSKLDLDVDEYVHLIQEYNAG